MNTSLICVDASLVIKLVVREPFSAQTDALWSDWIDQDIEAVAPALLRYETTAVLRKKVYRKLLQPAEADTAFERAMSLAVETVDPEDLHPRAWELARRLDQPSAYDCHYLALAEVLDCPFYTGDERLFHAVRPHLRWIHWIGEHSAAP